ncbi:MAG: type II toxin-antitoxin system VapC family toxin [Acidiphilium sp.]|nr:type II toxin-antitoxin system VapC family toxin [Acidiphilium sp.]MDD4934403.1 type II toxin-antitoxin system VapC family toxin [Acidiphilium sp.]
MVIDTSAVVAILFGEPDQRRYDEAIEAAPTRLISAVTRVELAMVVEGRKGTPGRHALERFFKLSCLDIVAVTPQHAELAIEAFRRFGRGRHPAGLNIGDCFSYALAAATRLPLLFKGDDFRQTDLIPAL